MRASRKEKPQMRTNFLHLYLGGIHQTRLLRYYIFQQFLFFNASLVTFNFVLIVSCYCVSYSSQSMAPTTADITKGSKEVAERLKDIEVVDPASGQKIRLGSLWEAAKGPVVFTMFRRFG